MILTREPVCASGVGLGWEMIVQECDRDIAAIDPDYILDQYKEKFAGLRYYVSLSYDFDTPEARTVDKIIEGAEHKCAVTCEDCGQPGELRSKGRYWMRTLCDQCDSLYLKRTGVI